MSLTSCNGPICLEDIALQTMTDTPPCFTVGIWYRESYLVFFGCRTYFFPSLPNRLNFDSSEESTLLHCFGFKCWNFCASVNRAFRFFLLIKAFLTLTHLNSPTSCRRRDTVLLLTLARFWSRSSRAILDAVFSTFFVDLRLMILSTCTIVFRGLPDRGESDRHLVCLGILTYKNDLISCVKH